MRAYKFLREGATSPFGGMRWPMPAPGGAGAAWVEASDPYLVHACRPAQLPYWANEELWEVELDGELRDATDAITAPRGRLVREVRAWREGGRIAFCDACHARAAAAVRASGGSAPKAVEMLRDFPALVVHGNAAAVGYVEARIAVALSAPADDAGATAVFRAARLVQAEWLRAELGLVE